MLHSYHEFQLYIMKSFLFIRILLLSFIAPLTSSCTTTLGRNFDTTHVDDIKTGIHTKENIREWFGEPYSTGAADSELRQFGCVDGWIYLYSVGSIGGGNAKSLAVYFDSEGKVCSQGYSN